MNQQDGHRTIGRKCAALGCNCIILLNDSPFCIPHQNYSFKAEASARRPDSSGSMKASPMTAGSPGKLVAKKSANPFRFGQYRKPKIQDRSASIGFAPNDTKAADQQQPELWRARAPASSTVEPAAQLPRQFSHEVNETPQRRFLKSNVSTTRPNVRIDQSQESAISKDSFDNLNKKGDEKEAISPAQPVHIRVNTISTRTSSFTGPISTAVSQIDDDTRQVPCAANDSRQAYFVVDEVLCQSSAVGSRQNASTSVSSGSSVSESTPSLADIGELILPATPATSVELGETLKGREPTVTRLPETGTRCSSDDPTEHAPSRSFSKRKHDQISQAERDPTTTANPKPSPTKAQVKRINKSSREDIENLGSQASIKKKYRPTLPTSDTLRNIFTRENLPKQIGLYRGSGKSEGEILSNVTYNVTRETPGGCSSVGETSSTLLSGSSPNKTNNMRSSKKPLNSSNSTSDLSDKAFRSNSTTMPKISFVNKVPSSSSAPISQSNPDTATKAKRSFNSDAFDIAIYEQFSNATHSIGPRRNRVAGLCEEELVTVAASPFILGMHNRSKEWHRRKQEEIERRGGRKRWFGKVAERARWLRSMQAEAEAERNEMQLAGRKPLPKDPQPQQYSRVLDFGDVPEDELPDDVRSNRAWMEACTWLRQSREKASKPATREQLLEQSQKETRRFFMEMLRMERIGQADVE